MGPLMRRSLVAIPDYHWEKHGKPLPRGTIPRRHTSDITDYGPRQPLRRPQRAKLPPALENDDDSDSDNTDVELCSLISDESSVAWEEDEEDKPQEKPMLGYDWVSKRPMVLRSRSDLTLYESKAIRDDRRRSSSAKGRCSRRPRVRFSNVKTYFSTSFVPTPQEKALLYWTPRELRSFREECARENAQRAREKKERRASRSRSSSAEREKQKLAKEEARIKKLQKTTAEIDSVLDSLQLAMQQSQALVAGY